MNKPRIKIEREKKARYFQSIRKKSDYVPNINDIHETVVAWLPKIKKGKQVTETANPRKNSVGIIVKISKKPKTKHGIHQIILV